MKFNFYCDPGHGWAKVPLKLLNSLCIMGEISGYSYIREQYAYLEEDCDLSLFCQTMDNAGKEVKFKTEQTDKTSKIRNYESYTYQKAFNNLLKGITQ